MKDAEYGNMREHGSEELLCVVVVSTHDKWDVCVYLSFLDFNTSVPELGMDSCLRLTIQGGSQDVI